ncbi:MAG: HsdR family type I site-specific deoxyribonuclease [Spirochaetaceae bacterium]|jgi:type I restriction enzyme R subunit|nr:HsdR family type I site-specific deoxyribonuclease [Spirochaetaceae bacterium]
MTTVNNPDAYLEKEFQAQAVDVLQKIGYTLLLPEDCARERGDRYHVLLKDILRAKLHELNLFEYGGAKYRFKPANIERAIDELDASLSDGLMKSNEKIYDALLLGRDLPETIDNNDNNNDGRTLSFDFSLRYIDWEHSENNTFHIVREFSVSNAAGNGGAIPDIVLFVNGIPFGVIECKAPVIDENYAVEQHIRNQGAEYIPQLFKFAQILLASNKNAVKYATAGTPKKFWNIWREQDAGWQKEKLALCVTGRLPTEQDRALVSLFSPERLLRLTRYFTLYDANVKKIARYQQFFAVEEIIKTVGANDPVTGCRQSGVIWHTQGSGKSLTMVMLAKYLLEHIPGCKVIMVTDRTELDRQLEQTFSHTRLKPARATSGKNLIDLINEGRSDIVTTVINKFNAVENSKLKIESRDVFVLVDESHRSNYGELAAKMRLAFPRGCYIGFTGTPLIKNEKTAARFGGKYIHKYTIKDGVDDKAIVPLIYEGRFVEQNVDGENIDLWFNQITRRLSEKQVDDLKSRWSQLRRLTSTNTRIRRIALDINNHFCDGYKNTGFKAMLACNFKRDAVRYLECFEQLGDLTAAVVVSSLDMREGHDDIDESSDDKVIQHWKNMMNRYGSAENYEDSIKNQFLDGDLDILIVCGKLLTGFDAPRAQVIYIDKELKDHGLLQAIARVNRLYDGKDYGLVVDYRGLISKLDEAVGIYSGAGLENFDSGEIKGAVVDVIAGVGKIRETYSALLDIFGELRNSRDTEALEVYLAAEETRESFYAALCGFGKALSITLNSERIYEALSHDEDDGNNEIERYKQAFAFFSKVRRSVKIRYADAIDSREYEPLMQNLLDTYLTVAGLKQITNPVDILNRDEMEKELYELGSPRAKADAIRSALTKSIVEHRDENPAFYDSFSKRIREVLEEYKNRVISEAEYLKKMAGILDSYRKGQTDIAFPEKIKGNINAQAFYGIIMTVLDGVIDPDAHIETAADIALAITTIIERHNTVDWQNNTDIHKRIEQDIDNLFYEYREKGFYVDFGTVDKISENVKIGALRRFQ